MMECGDLLIVSDNDLFFIYYMNINKKFHKRVKLESGCYLIVENYLNCFYEIIKDNKKVFISPV